MRCSLIDTTRSLYERCKSCVGVGGEECEGFQVRVDLRRGLRSVPLII